MKILITGANGYVGMGLLENLRLKEHEIIPVGFDVGYNLNNFHNLDLSDVSKACAYIENVKPDVIIHLAGNKDVIRCETDKVFSMKVNYEISRNIIKQCAVRGIRLIYISTDYVFNGVDGPFGEVSRPMPTTQYGKDKLAVENMAVKVLSNCAIVRSAGIFGLKMILLGLL